MDFADVAKYIFIGLFSLYTLFTYMGSTVHDKKALKQLNENKKIDQINSIPLKNYYRKTLIHIQELATQIDQVSSQLLVYRQKRRASKKDILDLLQRKERMMRDYKTLPKIEEES